MRPPDGLSPGDLNGALLGILHRIDRLTAEAAPLRAMVNGPRRTPRDLGEMVQDLAIAEAGRRLANLEAELDRTKASAAAVPIGRLDRAAAKRLGVPVEGLALHQRPVEVLGEGWRDFSGRVHTWAWRASLSSAQQATLRQRWGINRRGFEPPDASVLGLQELDRIPDHLWPVAADADAYTLPNGEVHRWDELPMSDAEVAIRTGNEFAARLRAKEPVIA